MSLYITGGQILLHSEGDWQVKSGDLWIEGQTIKAINPPGIVLPDNVQARRLDAAGQLILPGFINAHYHSHDNLIRGTGRQQPLELWSLEPTPLRQEYTPREAYVSTLLGCAELMTGGCTSVIDHLKLSPHLDPAGLKAVVDAYRIAGLRAIVAPVISDRPFTETLPFTEQERATCGQVQGWSIMPASEQIDRVETLIRTEDDGVGRRLRIGVGPSAPQRCTDALLTGAAGLAQRHQTTLHMHALETKLQRKRLDQLYHTSFTKHLANLNALGPHTQLVHMVWPTAEELEDVAASDTVIVHNPVANVYLGSGLAPVRQMLKLHINVALGSDSACDNHSHNMFETIKWAGLIHNLASPDPDCWLSPAIALQMATLGGAQAMGRDGRIGKIEPGAIADLSLIDLNSPGLIPFNNPLEQLGYAASQVTVKRVIVDGQLIYDQKPLAFDLDDLYKEARLLAAARLHKYQSAKPNPVVQQTILTAYLRENEL